MAKVVILGDCHLGARNGSNHFSNYFNRFFSEVLYPYCVKNGIKHIIQLGDMFDNRTSLSLKAYARSKEIWFAEMQRLGIEMTVLLGNHDIYHRNSLEINSPELLLKEFDNINIINTPSTISIDGFDFDIVPWICTENEEEVNQFVRRKDRSSVLCGHLELSGFAMYRGVDSHGGMSSALFDSYSLVFSGHYHTRSEKGNIVYTGIPYEITWSDYADPKGFYVFDTTTRKKEFVHNPLTIFQKLVYSNGCKVPISDLGGKIVKVVVTEKKDAVLYERWLDSIRLVSPYDLSIVEGIEYTSIAELDDSIEIEDTAKIIDSYIDNIETSVDKDELKKYIQLLYNEALTLDDSL